RHLLAVPDLEVDEVEPVDIRRFHPQERISRVKRVQEIARPRERAAVLRVQLVPKRRAQGDPFARGGAHGTPAVEPVPFERAPAGKEACPESQDDAEDWEGDESLDEKNSPGRPRAHRVPPTGRSAERGDELLDRALGGVLGGLSLGLRVEGAHLGRAVAARHVDQFRCRAGGGHYRDADGAVRLVRNDDVLRAHGGAGPGVYLAVVHAPLAPLNAAWSQQDSEVHVGGPGFAVLGAGLTGGADIGEMRAREPPVDDRTQAAVARNREEVRDEALELGSGSSRLDENDHLLLRSARGGGGSDGRGGRRRGGAAEERKEGGDG